MSILETARKMAEVAVSQKGLIKQIDLITIQTTELRSKRKNMSKEERDRLDRQLKQLHKRKVELEHKLEHNEIEEAASVEETAAPLSKEKYDWYKYVGPRGMKITNTRGNRTVTLKNGSMFGVRPATSNNGKTRIVTEELGPTIVFSFEQGEATKITSKGVRIPVKVTFKRPGAPAAIKKVVRAAKKAAGVKAKDLSSGAGASKEATAAYALIVGQLDSAKLSKETVVYLKWASKQATKLAKKPSSETLLDAFASKKAPKLKTKKIDSDNGNIRTAEAMGRFIPAIAKRWKKDVAKYNSNASDAWETVSIMLSDLADYTKLYVALCSGNRKAIDSASYFDTNIREELPKSVWNWLGKQGRMGY